MADVTRPQPVVAAANIAGTINGVITALATIAVVFGAVTQTDASSIVNALVAAVGALVGLVTVMAPILQARQARDLVTPLSDPRDASGVALTPAVDPATVVVDAEGEVT